MVFYHLPPVFQSPPLNAPHCLRTLLHLLPTPTGLSLERESLPLFPQTHKTNSEGATSTGPRCRPHSPWELGQGSGKPSISIDAGTLGFQRWHRIPLSPSSSRKRFRLERQVLRKEVGAPNFWKAPFPTPHATQKKTLPSAPLEKDRCHCQTLPSPRTLSSNEAMSYTPKI